MNARRKDTNPTPVIIRNISYKSSNFNLHWADCWRVKEFFCSRQFGFSSPFGVMFQHLLFVEVTQGKLTKLIGVNI